MWFKRRPKPPSDWFICPVCGAEVKVGAKSCRECGSDETTGWSDATIYDDLDLPEPEAPLVPDTFEEFVAQGRNKAKLGPPALLVVVVVVVLYLIWSTTIGAGR